MSWYVQLTRVTTLILVLLSYTAAVHPFYFAPGVRLEVKSSWYLKDGHSVVEAINKTLLFNGIPQLDPDLPGYPISGEVLFSR